MIQLGMIQRRLFLVGGPALLLPGCGKDLIGPPEAGPMYVVRPQFPAAPAAGAKVPWALAILRPDLPSGLDSDRIALFQPDGTMDYYAKATYPDRLPPIVQHALLDGFEASGRIDAVAPEEAALHADYNLAIEVKDFAAHYNQPDGVPGVTVSITAKLTTAHGRAIVGSFSTVQTGAASVNSTGAAVQALQQALGAAVKAIVDWALTFPMPVTQQPVSTASPGKPAEQLLHDATRGSRRLRDAPAPQ
ncbi:MAG: membrane integrity-associated transporter subunit PqiC [Alphaproteobacteria bacterium]|nr:membrane integrity-associated transporter subunit PqiC [Alphaproteobacteria bacterium]